MRKGADKGGATAAIWDFVVHPETVAMAATNSAIKNMLVETAMERIESAASVKLSRRARCALSPLATCFCVHSGSAGGQVVGAGRALRLPPGRVGLLCATGCAGRLRRAPPAPWNVV